MAIGHPRLAVHYIDGTIRLYELASGAFVQLASTGLYPHAPGNGHPDGVKFPPAISFMKDSDFLMLVHAVNADDTRARTFDNDLTLKATSNNLCDVNTGSSVGPVSTIPFYYSGELHAPVGTVRLSQTMAGNPASLQAGYDANLGADVGVRGLLHTPDGQFRMVPHKLASTLRAGERTGFTAGTIPLYNSTKTVADVPYPITNGVWVTNTLFLGVGALGAIVFRRDTGTETASVLLEVSKPAGDPVAVAAAQDGRWAAASFYDGSTYRTTIYRRQGPFLSPVKTIDNFGKLLAFTADSGLLVDAGLKKAQARTDLSWADAPGVMANIADNADAQATSTHVDQQIGHGQLYNNRLAELQAGTLNLGDLYATILTTGAPAFNPTHTTATAAKGSAEVTNGSWPVGGYHLTGVAGAAVGTREWKLAANDIDHLIYPDGLAFRYLLVYEKTTDKPVAFFDYQATFSIPRSSNLNIAFDSGLLYITE